MAKLPQRQKVTLLLFRRAEPDELLLVPIEARRMVRWALPFTEVEAEETPREAARLLALGLVEGDPVTMLDVGTSSEYRVKAGPHAGEWTERFHAVEVAVGTHAREGSWVPHYEAKAQSESPRAREAITRLREVARLKP